MPRVLMSFDHRDCWSVHFIEADCRTLIGPKMRYYHRLFCGAVGGGKSFKAGFRHLWVPYNPKNQNSCLRRTFCHRNHVAITLWITTSTVSGSKVLTLRDRRLLSNQINNQQPF